MSTEPDPWANGGGGSVDLGIASTSPAVGRQATAGDGEEIYQRGVLIDRYVVLSMLGEGGMGIVYVAYDPELDRSVAIKLLHPDLAAAANQDPQARLLREAQALARLSHPNVVAIHDVGTLGTRVWLAMELVKGRTLKVWQGQRSWREVVDAYCMAGRGLLAAHEVGLVHRDFKPESGAESQVPENTSFSRLRVGCVPTLYQAAGPVKTERRGFARLL